MNRVNIVEAIIDRREQVGRNIEVDTCSCIQVDALDGKCVHFAQHARHVCQANDDNSHSLPR